MEYRADPGTHFTYHLLIVSNFKIIKSNLKVIEYPIIFKDRKVGKSKLKSSKILNWFLYIIKLFISSLSAQSETCWGF